LTPSFSVVICAYSLDRWGDLCAAVESVERQSLRPLETIVVVDHNAELGARALARFGDRGVRVVDNDGEQGLSYARNAGIAVAHGDVVAFLDDDAVAEPQWLETLAKTYAADVVGVGGAIEPNWLAGRPKTFPPEFDWVVGCTYRGHPTTRAPVRNLIGANMSFRRELFAELGGFRSEIGRVGTRPVGCEETEFCLRVARARPRSLILYEPEAAVLHSVPASRATWGYFVRRCFGEGISKAAVASLAGRADAMRTERSYVARTVARGVGTSVAAAARGDVAALGRAARMVVGVAAAAAGYAYAVVPPTRLKDRRAVPATRAEGR
jgi:glycosyltransferase involved in cell wall biosynthesis